MLWLPSLVLLLKAQHLHSKCIIVGLIRHDFYSRLESEIEWSVKTPVCSKPEDKHWLVADQDDDTQNDLDYCDSKDLQPLCPEECPMVVRPIVPKALFACIALGGGSCFEHNVRTPYPNPESKMCEACKVTECKLCASPHVCEKCFEGFFQNKAGNACVFGLDKTLHLAIVLPCIVGVILVILMSGLIYRAFAMRAPAAARANLEAVRQGRRARHFHKCQDWANPTDATKRRYPLCMNLHKEDICGVGLGLYYNGLIFQFYVATVCFFTTLVLSKATSMTEYLDRFDVSFSKYFSDQLQGISFQYSIALSILYVFLFISSLAFARMQAEYAEWWDSKETDMEDYVLCVNGLPQMVSPNEALIRSDLEKAFQSLVPDVELHGVSIAYDFFERRQEVEEVLHNFIMQKDIDAGLYRSELIDEQDTQSDFSDHSKVDAGIVRSWFTSKPLHTTGVVFAVFKTKTNHCMVAEKLKETNGMMSVPRYGQESIMVRCKEENMEPPTVFWWALGLRHSQIWKRAACFVLKILIAVLLVALIIFWPISHFLIEPFANTGNPPSAGLMLLAGIIMGIIYGQFYVNTQGLSFEVGFHRKDSMDACIFFVFFVVVLLNALFQMSITVRGAVKWPPSMTFSELLGTNSLRAILLQHKIVKNVYQFMMPGLYFMPRVLEPLAAGLVPYVLHQLFALIVYVWGAFPGPLAAFFKAILPFAPPSMTNYHPRNAEQALKCMEIPLAFVYADNLLVCTICFGMLMFVTDCHYLLFMGMMIWTIFLYFFCRWSHLRFNKRAFFTTNSLDVTVTYAWGIPLSVLAMACYSWVLRHGGPLGRVRYGDRPLYMLIPFLVSMVLWLVCYYCLRRRPNPVSFKEQDMDKTYEDCRMETLYSWFNTNPIHVLKSHYCSDLLGDHVKAHGRTETDEVCFFEVGKEYQLLSKENRKGAITRAHQTDFWEIETYLDKLFRCMERCCCRRKICCVIDGTEGREGNSEVLLPSARESGFPPARSEIEMKVV